MCLKSRGQWVYSLLQSSHLRENVTFHLPAIQELQNVQCRETSKTLIACQWVGTFRLCLCKLGMEYFPQVVPKGRIMRYSVAETEGFCVHCFSEKRYSATYVADFGKVAHFSQHNKHKGYQTEYPFGEAA